MDWFSGELLVTDRSGILYVVRDGEIIADYTEVLGDLYPERQGGFLDVQAHPNHSENDGFILVIHPPQEKVRCKY